MPDVRETLGQPAPPNVTLAGLVPQAEGPLHLAASDILLSPHVRNADGTPFFGSPTKLFEYMAMGKAIVASDLDQIGEVLRPAVVANDLPASPPESSGALAVLCEPGSEDEIRAGIRFLVEHPDWRARLGENARATARGRYTWRHHVEAILTRLDEVLASGEHGL
jgi:glycosyltransferase involved in cell wall biosynthesis